MLSILLSLDVVILDVIAIDHDFETSRANLDRCSKDNPLWYTFQQVDLGEDCSAEEDISCFFETGLTEYGDVPHSIDAVSVDSSQDTSRAHPVCENWEMPMVDVDGVGLENLLELVDEGWSCGLDAQDVEDLCDIVGVWPVGVDFGMGKDLT